MGKPQGDGLPEPTVYERLNEHGEVETTTARGNVAHYNLQARGWVQSDNQETATEQPAGPGEAARRAGSPQPARARVVQSGAPVADADGASSV